MKKLLLLLLFIPLISFGQVEAATYKITTTTGEVIKSKSYRINKQKRIVDIQKMDGKFIRLRTDKIKSYDKVESKEELKRLAAEQSRLDSIQKVADDLKKELIRKEQEAINSVWDNWSEGEYVDEFGDKTGEKYKYMVTTDGVFSNSATNNSKLYGQFTTNGKSLSINVLEYGSSRAKSIEATFELVKIKQPDGNIASIKRVFFTKDGTLYFSDEDFKQVCKALSLKGDYTMVFNRSGKYSKSSYRLKFSM